MTICLQKQHFILFFLMKLYTIFLLVILSIVSAEQYAMIFGTADGWGNYGVPSVFDFIF